MVCPKRTVIRITNQHNTKNATTRPTNVKTANKETVVAQSPKPNAQFWRNSENARRFNLKACLYRHIMVEKGYKVREVDKSIEEQFYDTSKHYLGKGDITITGDGPDGSTTFKVSNFQTPDGKTVTGYGVYKIKEGYAKFFNFIEIASSKDPIKDLDQGLQSGNHYLVGFQC